MRIWMNSKIIVYVRTIALWSRSIWAIGRLVVWTEWMDGWLDICMVGSLVGWSFVLRVNEWMFVYIKQYFCVFVFFLAMGEYSFFICFRYKQYHPTILSSLLWRTSLLLTFVQTMFFFVFTVTLTAVNIHTFIQRHSFCS